MPLCVLMYINVSTDKRVEKWKKTNNSGSAATWQNYGLLIYNLAVTWQSPPVCNRIQWRGGAVRYLCCLAVTACPHVWMAGWRTGGCGEMECGHNWGCCLNSPLRNLTREQEREAKMIKTLFSCWSHQSAVLKVSKSLMTAGRFGSLSGFLQKAKRKKEQKNMLTD